MAPVQHHVDCCLVNPPMKGPIYSLPTIKSIAEYVWPSSACSEVCTAPASPSTSSSNFQGRDEALAAQYCTIIHQSQLMLVVLYITNRIANFRPSTSACCFGWLLLITTTLYVQKTSRMSWPFSNGNSRKKLKRAGEWLAQHFLVSTKR